MMITIIIDTIIKLFLQKVSLRNAEWEQISVYLEVVGEITYSNYLQSDSLKKWNGEVTFLTFFTFYRLQSRLLPGLVASTGVNIFSKLCI